MGKTIRRSIKPTGMAAVTGDFENKQFAETEVTKKVVEQYDELQARIFYKYVMGMQLTPYFV